MVPPPAHLDLAPYLSPGRVLIVGHPISKAGLLARLIERTATHASIANSAAFTKAIYDREDVGSTGIGGGVAVPHARLNSVRSGVLSLGILPHGVDFAARDGLPVHLVVMIASPEEERHTHLLLLATVASLLRRPGLVQRVVASSEPASALAAFLA